MILSLGNNWLTYLVNKLTLPPGPGPAKGNYIKKLIVNPHFILLDQKITTHLHFSLESRLQVTVPCKRVVLL